MTLDDYLRTEQEHAEYIYVEHQDELQIVENRLVAKANLVLEHHPIAADVLPILQKVWTATYYRFHENTGSTDKISYIHKLRRVRHPARRFISTPEGQMSLSNAARHYKTPLTTLCMRLHRGWSEHEALFGRS